MEGGQQQPAQPAQPAQAPAVAVTPATEDDVSLGKAFYARTVGIGPAFVESLEKSDDADSVVTTLRKRAGTATENIKAASTATLSRLSSAAAEVVPAVGDSVSAAVSWVAGTVGLEGESADRSLADAVAKIRVKDMMVPGLELQVLEVHQTVGQLEQLLRDERIHSVPVWNPASKRWEGVIDTGDLVTWVSVKFPKLQLDAWSTFRQEKEFATQRVTDIINVSGRNRFCATTPETEALQVLEAFRDLDIHRVFVRRSERDLIGVLTQTDILRFLHQSNFAGKAQRVGDRVRAGRVISCFQDELCVSAFKIMWGSSISAVAVVNDKGQAVACLTSYDVVVKAESIITVLFKTIRDFLGLKTVNAHVSFVSVRPQATFGELLDKMVAAKVSHCFIVDDDGCPTAVLTAKDILVALLPKPQ